MSRFFSRRVVLAALVGLAGALALAAGLGAFAHAGVAASPAKPKPHTTAPPSITGVPKQGQRLLGHIGVWSGNPTTFAFFWLRCKSGGCPRIPGANAQTYDLTAADVGSRIRFQVLASNSDGSTLATSAPTAVVTAAAPPPPPTGCPPGSGPDQVADLSPPAHLILDGQQSTPSIVTRGSVQLTVRYHVSDTCGHSVQGALVYVTAVPFNQFSISPEQTTGADGWANLNMSVLGGFPASQHQQLLALFVRARKPGENLNAGIAARRLFSIPVSLG